MALPRTGHPADVIHHADRDSGTYNIVGLRVAAGDADMALSFGSTGNAHDNAAIESFWARLKVKIKWIRGSIWFPTRAECHAYRFEFIEVFYDGNATKPASITSPHPSTLTSGATTTDSRVRHYPVSRCRGQCPRFVPFPCYPG